MENNTLAHYGVKGMKWGVRKSQTSLRSKVGSIVKKKASEKDTSVKRVKKTPPAKAPKEEVKKDPSTQYTNPKKMSNDELKEAIGRMELMKKYNSLYDDTNSVTVSKGKKFVEKVLTKAGENITTQVVTYGLGKAVNRIFNEEIVNPKKGQKDK